MPIQEIDYDPFAEQYIKEKEAQKRRNILEVDYDPFAGLEESPAATPSRKKALQPPASSSTLGGVASALGQGLAEGVTTALPEMAGEALEFAGTELLGETVAGIGRDMKEWADAKGKALYGEQKKREGLERWVYEGSKMLAPSVIPAGAVGAGVRALTKVGKLVKAGKAAEAAGDAVKAAEYFDAATKAANLSNNVASASTAGLFGASQAQSTRDTAEKTATKLEAEGDFEGASKAREAGKGWAPYASGAIEAGGEFFGTKYLGKLFRLDEAGVAKRGAKQLVSDFLKTLGVEVGTEMGQQGGEAYVEKVSGIRPDADPLAEALDVIGPTAFMTILTGGAAGAVNTMRRPDDAVDLLEDEKTKDQPDITETIRQAIGEQKKAEAQVKPRPSTAKEAAETFFGKEAVENERAIESLRRRGLYVPEDQAPVKSAAESAMAFEAEQARQQGEALRAQAPPERLTVPIGESQLGVRQAQPAEEIVAPEPSGEVAEPISAIEQIDQKANEAATSPLNDRSQPTEPQKQAGNYKKGKILGSDVNPGLSGLEISIENPRGSERSGKDKGGKPWSVFMQHPYGYFRGTLGKDKDMIDVTIGPNPESEKAFIVDQIDPATGKFDEHKTIVGATSEEEARQVYLDNYQEGWQGLGSITEMPLKEFKEWLKSGRKTKPVAYKEVDRAREVSGNQRSDVRKEESGVEKAAPGTGVVLGGEKATVRSEPVLGGENLQFSEKTGGKAGERAGLTEPGGKKITAPTPPAEEIAPPAPAGEAVAPKTKGFDPDNDRQRNILVRELLASEAPEVKALVKQAEETWPGEDPGPVVESQIDYDLLKTPEKWLGTAAAKEILARKGWGEKAKETPPAPTPIPEPERAPEGPRKLTLYRGGKAGNWYTTTEDAAREYANLGEDGKVLKEDVTFKRVAEKADILKAAESVKAKPNQALYWLVSPETSEDAPKVIAELKKQGFDAVHLPEGEDFAPSGKGIESYLKLETTPPPKAEPREGISPHLKSLILMDMRTALEEGHKYGTREEDELVPGQGTNSVDIGTTNPPWLWDGVMLAMKRKYKQSTKKEEVVAVINKEINGKGDTLTPKQLKIWFLIEDQIKEMAKSPHYMKAEEVMSGPIETLIADYNEGAAMGQYQDSDLEFPPTQKEVAQAASEVVGEEYAKGSERLQAYQAERGEAREEENEAPAAKAGPAEEVTTKTEKRKEPWQMSRDEFAETVSFGYYRKKGGKDKNRRLFATYGISRTDDIPQKFGKLTKGTEEVITDLHRREVEMQLRAKQQDEASVLNPYEPPGLKKRAQERLDKGEYSIPENLAAYPDLAEKYAPKEEPKTEPTKAGTQAVIPGASEAETFMLTGAPGEVGTAASKGKKQETATIEEVAGEMEKEKPAAKPYFTVKKAQALTQENFSKLSDDALQKAIVTLRDFNRFVGDTQTYRQQLDEGGYFKDVVDPNASGVVPKDMWLLNNLRTALDEALAEKKKRQGNPAPKPKKEKARQPWEMTKEEFAKEATVSRDASRNYIAVTSPHGGDFVIRSLETEKYTDADAIASSHLDYIKTAIKQGKPIPPAVLAEYPELGKKAEAGEPNRADEIRKELSSLQNQYEKKMAQQGKSAMVPPSIKSDALSSITKKMDKLEEELRQIEKKPTTEDVGKIEDFGEKPPATFREFVESKGIAWPLKTSDPRYAETLAAYEATKKEEPKAAPAKVNQAAKKQAETLRKHAEALQKQIDQKRHPAIADQRVTRRRANIAAGMGAEADRMERFQKTMIRIADAADSGELPASLSNITNRAQVEALEQEFRKVQGDAAAVTPEMIDQKAMLRGHVHEAHLRDLLKATEGKKGSVAPRGEVSRIRGNGGYFYGMDAVNSIETLLRMAPNEGRWIRDSISDFRRLYNLGAKDNDSFKTLLKDYLSVREGKRQKTAQDIIRERERQLIGTKMPGYFPTPKPIVETMLEKANIEEGETVLEPSAGKGNIADLIKEQGKGDLSVIEIAPTLRDILEAKEHNIVDSDFLEHNETYDKIVMNPPFENLQDIDHVQHAYKLLKPGGRVVSIMSASPFFRSDKKAAAFRDWLEEVGGSEEKLPEKAFYSSERPTGVSTHLVVIDKPQTRETPQGVEMYEVLDQTDTPEFKKWFADSKVVDAERKPLVVYHGTTAPEDFSEFAVGEPIYTGEEDMLRTGSGADMTTFLGSHFAKEKSVANKFAKGLYGEREFTESGGRVIPAFLSIKRPFVTDEQTMRDEMLRGSYNTPSVEEAIEFEAGRKGQDIDELFEKYEADEDFRASMNDEALALEIQMDDPTFELSQEMASSYREKLRSQGYDGIQYQNEVEGGTSYVIFEPQQAKSAIANRGTFSPENPDIRYNVESRDAIRSGATFAEQLDDFAAGKIVNRREPITIGQTPYVLQMLGAEQVPIVITQGVVEKAISKEEGQHGHGISIETLKQLPAQIADPVMVFDSATGKDSLVVMTELRQDGKSIVAAVDLSQKSGRLTVNNISTVHPRESEHHFINWINRGLLRYMNKSKSRAWSVTSGLQLPGVRGPMQGFKNKILFSHDLVKWVNDRQGKENLSVRDQHRRGLLKPAKIADVRRFFPNQEVGLDKNGNIYVKTRGGKYVTIYRVDHISADPNVLQAGYGVSDMKPGSVIPGAFGVTSTGEYYIKLHRVFGDVWTLGHEGLGHFCETAGIINSRDVEVLRQHIRNLHRDGRWDPANRKDVGGPEDRANFIADRLAVKEQKGPIGSIILRIRAFIDGILETFGIRNPESILRGIESGRVFERTGREGKGEERYAPAEKGIVDFSQDPEWHDIAYKEPTPESIAKLKKWLKENPYALVRMYHGTASEHDVKTQGLKRTTRRTQKSLQSRHGVVSLSIFPGMARDFGRMAYPGKEISVYAVDVPVNRLIPDTDQLKNKRYWGERTDIGGTLADSLAYGHGAQVKGDIQASWIIEKSRGDETYFAPAIIPARLAPMVDSIVQPGILSRAWDNLRYQAQDKFLYLNKAQSEAQRRTGAQLPEGQDAYLAETRYHGMAGAAIEDFDEKHVDPLLELMSEHDISVEQADEYLHARHAREANERLRNINPDREDNAALSGMTDEEADRILEQTNRGPKAQAFQRIARMVDAITKARRDLLVESGLETEDTIAKWEETYRYYVPLMREGKAEAMPRRGRGFEVRGGQKLRAGSEREVVNILANVVAQHEATIVRAEKAKVSRAFLEFAKANRGPWKIDVPEKVASMDEDGLVVYRANPLGYMLADNVLAVRVDGKDHHITFDERDQDGMRIAAALKNLDAADMGSVTRAVAKISRWLAMINTSLNPEFIISNFARDIQTAAYNMADSEADAVRMKAIKQVPSAFKGIREYQDNNRDTEWARWFNRFRNAGGQTGWIESYETIQDREKALISKIEDMKSGKIRSVKRGLTAAFDYIADVNTAIENGIRLSVFKNLVEANVPESKAARIAKELTVNFNRRGNMGPVLNAFYLFYNASIQGSARLIMAAGKSRKVRKFMAATVVFAALLDMMNRAIGGDDDDGENRYDKIAPWLKDRNLILMLPGVGGYLQIPLPWGYNVFHVMGQAAGEVLTKKNNDMMKSALRVGGAVVGAFNPMGSEASLLQMVSPSILDPFVQWAENKDWTGRKLRPSSNPFAAKPSSQTYWHSVREPSKWIAQKLNEITGGDEVRPGKIDISPESIDLAIDTVTGGTGKFVANLIGTPIKYAKGEDVETYEIPFLRRVYGKAGKQVLTQQYYENMDAVRLVSRQLTHYKNDPAKVREIAKEYKAEVRLIGRMQATQKVMKDLQEQLKASEKIKDKEIRTQREKKIEETMEKVMNGFNRNYNTMKHKEN